MVVFLFNWFGYRLLTDYLQQQSTKQLEAQLDRNDYDASRLIEMRVPLNIPYQVSASGFERVNGEIEIEGIHYNYVKRKIENGQLVLLCLPNTAKTKLESVKDDYYKLVNDLQHPAQNNNSKPGQVIKNPVTEYWQQWNQWSMHAFIEGRHVYNGYQAAIPSSPFIKAPVQPPDFCRA